jgi:hypothetical protein
MLFGDPVCILFILRATAKSSSFTLVWPTPPSIVIKVSDGTWFAETRQLTIGVRRRASFASPQQANDAAYRACALKLFVRASVPMVWLFPLGDNMACRSWEVVQPISLSTTNAAPDLYCVKYRPACSNDCSLSVDPYTATIGIRMPDY